METVFSVSADLLLNDKNFYEWSMEIDEGVFGKSTKKSHTSFETIEEASSNLVRVLAFVLAGE